MVKYPKISSLKDSIKWYNKHKESLKLPDELTFEGTVKLHGTNAGIIYNRDTSEIKAQSRNKVLSITDDNYGFSQFVSNLTSSENGADFLGNLFDLLVSITGEEYITIFGEWIGDGIQHGVGINNLEGRLFVIFGMIVGKEGAPEALPVFVENRELGIFNVLSVEQTYLTVDMTSPDDLQRFSEEIEKITLEYEESCPYTEFLFKVGEIKEEPECKIGEGLVWTCVDLPEQQALTFKSKGSKHSGNKKNKFREIAPLDTETLNNIKEFVEYALTESRLKQGLENIPSVDKEYTGSYIGWVLKDISEEDKDVFLKLGVSWKKVSGKLAAGAREYFLEACLRDAIGLPTQTY